MENLQNQVKTFKSGENVKHKQLLQYRVDELDELTFDQMNIWN